MKLHKFTLALLMCLSCQNLMAFDPVGPPASSSLSATIKHASFVLLHSLNYPDGPLQEVLDFIQVQEIPAKFGVVIDASRLKLPESTRVKIVAKDITILQAASLIAEQLKADILIQPGKILLVPRS